MKSGIYLIKNLSNGKGYVGSTINLAERKHQHFGCLRKNQHHSPHLQYSFNKYGKENFKYYIIAYCAPEELLAKEDFYINYFKTMDRKYGYNINTAERHTISEETKAKISKSVSIARTGKKHSKETKEKISKTVSVILTGKKHSMETKAKISKSLQGIKNPAFGKHHSLETKQKISKAVSIAMTGRKCSAETRQKISESLRAKNLTIPYPAIPNRTTAGHT